MDGFYVLKFGDMYYSNGEFMEPNKKYADRLRYGQASNIKRKRERFYRTEDKRIILEKV